MSRTRTRKSTWAPEPSSTYPDDDFAPTPTLAVPYDSVADAVHEILHRVAETTTVAETRRWIFDDARIERLLFESSKATLHLLDAVIDHEGSLPSSVAEELLAERGYENAPDVASRALDDLVRGGLLVPYRWHDLGHVYRMPLEIFEKVAPKVHGVSVPSVPIVPPSAPLDRRGPRDALVALAALAHFPVRTAQSGPHRTDVKKLALALGREDPWLDALLMSALDSHALVASNKRYLPRLDVLDDVAEGRRHARGGWPEGLEKRTEWFPAEALRRALAAELRVETLFEARPSEPGGLEAYERTTVDEVELVRRPQSSEDGTGDGHVTPSFEVFLGPAADLKITTTVALACEPTRLDAVATFKLTPSSIAAALRLGLSVDELLRALERVGPHGVPANVRATVLDWASAVGTLKVRSVFTVECSSSETADRAARALGAHVLQRPTPTLLLVDRDPHAKLAKAGLAPELDTSPPSEHAAEDESDPPLPLLHARPDPELRARFEAAEPEPTSPWARATPAQRLRSVLQEVPSILRDNARVAPSAPIASALRRLADLLERQSIELEAWLLERADPMSTMAALLEHPFLIAPYLTLDPKMRAEVRARSSEPVELVARALARRPQVTGELGRLLKKPSVARFAKSFLLVENRDGTADELASTEDVPLGTEREHDHATTFLQAAAEGRRVRLRLTHGRVVELAPLRVLPVGDDIALGGEDPKTGEARSVSARDVVSIETI